jgi:hypothetical protein
LISAIVLVRIRPALEPSLRSFLSNPRACRNVARRIAGVPLCPCFAISETMGLKLPRAIDIF